MFGDHSSCPSESTHRACFVAFEKYGWTPNFSEITKHDQQNVTIDNPFHFNAWGLFNRYPAK